MKSKTQKINKIFIKMMMFSFLAQIFILGILIIFVKNYMNHSQINMISDDLLIHDKYTIDKIVEYEILGSKYALDLELHNIGDMRKLDSIKFIKNTKYMTKLMKCDLLNSKDFKLCKSSNGDYLGASIVSFNNKNLGYILAKKKYSIAFPVPVKYDLFLILLSVIGIFIINIGLLFLPLKRKIETNTKHLLNIILTKNTTDKELSFLSIEEYKTIALTFIDEHNEITKLHQEKSYSLAIRKIAEQVAHDIRSPLTAITIALSDIASIPENKRVMLKNIFKRIKDIANNLLSEYVNTADNQNSFINDEVSSELIYFVLENIVSEKNYEYRGRGFKILLEGDEITYSCFSKINLAVFKRILSNLINNSMEAVSSNGLLKISIYCNDQFVGITLEDNGCGISPDILHKITEEGFSFGKKLGAGFGLFHAKQYLEKINATLNIKSVVNIGTTVNITLFRSENPSWFSETLNINHDSSIVVLDDDPTIHDAWVMRFLPFSNVNIIHFSTAADLMMASNIKACLYLIDYELLAENENGLDVIENLNLSHSSILVTNCFEDPVVRTRCKTLDVKIIPKPYVPFIPIIPTNNVTNKNAIVFIDDDELMRMTWLFAAEQAGKTIDIYAHPNEFIKQMDKYGKDTIIYIDHELGETIPGDIYAKEIYDNGFSKIHLTTGHPAEKFNCHPWLKSVIGKMPPF